MRMTKLVVSFNRHFFTLALFACAIGLILVALLEHPFAQIPLAVGVGLSGYFMVASILVSFIVYDASDLYKLRWWPDRCIKYAPEDGIVTHAGFDPASPKIRERFPQMRLRILDFFDAGKTTEASIRRAHELFPPTMPEERINAEVWPVESGSQDVVFVLSAAHELRLADQRTAFFREAKRVLKTEGQIIVIEQLRNFVNFACFGVAAFHFLSHGTWLRSFASADLRVTDEFSLTPFMRAFVLQSGKTQLGVAARG